jgi:MoaA/NifB/PqqE/SkfB family radical SAM enzyme
MLALVVRRQQGWYESPGHQVLVMLGTLSHARRANIRFRRLYFRIASMLKYRELVHLPALRAAIRLGGRALRSTRAEGLAAWYLSTHRRQSAAIGGMPLHTTFLFTDDDSRPMDFFAPILSCGKHSNIVFAWEGSDPEYNYRDRYGLAAHSEESEDTESSINDVSRIEPDVLKELQREGVSDFLTDLQSDSWRRANDLLKHTSPRAFIIALSLPEDDLGFCDDSLREWLPTLAGIHAAYPFVTFCLLERTTLDDSDPEKLTRAGVIAVRSRGLNHLSAMAVARYADAFFGTMGLFAYSALGYRKTGIYLGPVAGDAHVSEHGQWFLVQPSETELSKIIGGLVAAHAPHLTDGRGTPDPVTAAQPKPAAKVASPETKAGDREKTDAGQILPVASKWHVEPAERRTVTMYVDIFGYCNLRCPSCPVGNWPKEGEKAFTSGMIETRTFEKILEKAVAEANVTSVGLFNWTEPLLNPNASQLVRLVHGYGLTCSISSNLNVLKDPRDLLSSGLDWLRISVSGFSQEIYGHYHKNGNIERVKQNMRRLAKARDELEAKTDIEVFFHKYLDNEQDERLMRAFAESLGFRFVSAWAYLMPVEKMLAFAEPGGRHSATLSKQDRELIERLALSPSEALELTRKKKMNTCELYDFLTIDIRGNIFLCCAVSGERKNIIGNFLEMPLSEIYKLQLRHSLCGSCMKHGLPLLYSHGDPEFENIGERARTKLQTRNEPAAVAVGQ